MAVPTAAPPVLTYGTAVRCFPAVATLRPVWSNPAAFRAARATVVIPAFFAITPPGHRKRADVHLRGLRRLRHPGAGQFRRHPP